MKPRIFSVGSLVIRASPVIEWSDDEVMLSIKSIFRECSVTRGSAHEIDFASQNHKNREHVSRFLYLEREKVSVWELSDVRVLRSQNTSCRKNASFSTDKQKPLRKIGRVNGACGRTRTGDLRITNALLYQLSHASMPYSEKWPSRSQLFQYNMVLKIRQDFFENFS